VVSSSSFWERSIFELWKNMQQLDLIRVYIIVIMLACFFILLMHVSLLKKDVEKYELDIHIYNTPPRLVCTLPPNK
jgi:hypothetical protein